MPNQYENLSSKMKVAFANGRYDEALKLAKNIIQFNSAQTEPYIIAGDVYLLQNQYDKAEVNYKKAIQLDSNNGEYHFFLGNVYFGTGDFTKAIEYYAKAESLECSDDIKQKIYYIIGNLNQISGNNEEALLNYKKAGEIKGSNQEREDILLNQIEIYVNEGHYDQAEIAARSLKMISPDVFDYYHLLFQILLQRHKFNEAKEVLEEAKSYFSNKENQIEMIFDQALLDINIADRNHDDTYYQKAIQQLDTLNSTTNEKQIIYEKEITKSEILIRLNKIDDAIQLLKLIVGDEDVENIDMIERAQLTIMNCYYTKKDYMSTIVYARKMKESKNLMIKHNGYYFEALATKEMSKIDKTKSDEARNLYQIAIAYFRNASASNPNDIVALIYRAKSYCDIASYNKALEIARILPDEAQKMIEEYIKEKGG